MKLNMVLGKKQIILASLIMILSIAVYLNALLAKKGEDFAITGTLKNDSSSSKNLGDAQLVNNNVDNNYFIQAKLDKQASRDKSMEAITTKLKDSSLSNEEKEKYKLQADELSKMNDIESRIENLIKAKGFEQCLAYISSENANIIVKTNGLKTEQAAQIKDIILSQSDIKVENVRITESK